MINLNRIRLAGCLIIAVIFLGAVSSSAESIKDRMVARLPAINALKDKGLIGENKDGFLEFRTGEKAQQDVVSAENKDREAVYGAIAKKQGASVALVGQRRAKQIADIGGSGWWFEKPDGTWYKK